jgi:hypothetical protein
MKRFLLVVFFFCGAFSVFTFDILNSLAAAFNVPRYPLGSIPDKMVYHGEAAHFLVYWEGHPDADFKMQVSPRPNGNIAFLPYSQTGTGGNEGTHVFVYAPAQSDITPFSVTISAMDEGRAPAGGENYSHTFEITPAAGFPAEATVFGSESHTQPPVISKSKINVIKEPIPVPTENFNYNDDTVSTINVTIVGGLVEIEAGHENGLCEQYFVETVRLIENMKIIGEKVIFRSPARVKGANVTIYARELRFEGSGSLSTTPEEKPTPAKKAEGGCSRAGRRKGDIIYRILFCRPSGCDQDNRGKRSRGRGGAGWR